MYCRHLLSVFIGLLFISLYSTSCLAIDTIKVSSTQQKIDKRAAYKNEVLHRAMEATRDEYGPYIFVQENIRMNRDRALSAIRKGTPNNVYIAPSLKEWDEKTIAIKLPIRLGLLSYRLLLVHKNDLEQFAKITTLEQLKKMKAGMRSGWITTSIFKELNFNLTESQNFDGLFFLLDSHNFQYIPRSIYEIFDELHSRGPLLDNVVIEPTLALHIPTATYIYVSPNEKRLARRIEEGVKKLFETGKLQAILHRYYDAEIEQANIKNRRIIAIDNPYYNEVDRKNDAKYWYKLSQ